MGTQMTLPITGSRLHQTKAAVLARRIADGWQDTAACIGSSDPDAWFPDPSTHVRDLFIPLAICEGCPVRRSCLASGLLGAETGLWGGTNDADRDNALAELSVGVDVDLILDRLLDDAAAPNRRAA
jgi:hypothetical protein